QAYDATAYHRISAGMGFSMLGRDRLIFRAEHAAHVRWQKGVGAYVDLKGMRAAIPIAPAGAQKDAQRGMSEEMMIPIPYYPGYESLFPTGGMAEAEVDERELLHPLAEGAEAYYVYESGDSVTFRMPSGTTVRLRELRVRPRRPDWKTVVGSFWFDVRSGQLVRAAYRLSTPIDVWTVIREEDPKANKNIPWAVKGLASPMKAQLSAASIEYGLYEGRFWLPRLQTFEGYGQVSFVRVPFAMQHSFRYASVNGVGRDQLPSIAVANEMLDRRLDSLTSGARRQLMDSVRSARREATAARRDSARRGLLHDSVVSVSPQTLARRQQCDTSGYMVEHATAARDPEHKHESLRVAYRVPCDMSTLATAPELPNSIFDANEEIFGSKDLDALIERTLGMTAQPRWAPQRPVVHWGLDLTRYNRVEGLSSGISAEQQLGAGYTWRAVGRLGTADVEPNAEVTMARTNLSRTVSVTAYRRLVAANDWGNPLSFGSSLSTLLFGRDEGFYYRTGGIELAGTPDANVGNGGRVAWRLFAEQQRTAAVSTTFSFGVPWLPNMETRHATYVGGAVRVDHSYGLDPSGFRPLSGLRLEAAQPTEGDAMLPNHGRYARASTEATVSHGLGHDVLGALTLSGGSSAGDLPPQREWFLGGAHTIRGQRPDTSFSGNAYWMTQGEVARDFGGMRGIVFGDVGWTGDRRMLRDRAFGRPMSDVGVGTSFLDGLIRLDVARGIYPQERWRASAYVEARM
ncbi:MAG TPA: hypothetical protein VIF32_09145, partial [Gemmatimonadaceae bacterium]